MEIPRRESVLFSNFFLVVTVAPKNLEEFCFVVPEFRLHKVFDFFSFGFKLGLRIFLPGKFCNLGDGCKRR